MEQYKFKQDTVSQEDCYSMEEVERAIENIFKRKARILPKKKNAKILLKPNLNNDLNSFAGNSTDLRIIVSVIKALQKRGYKNIILADGPNCGITHMGINVFKRLAVDKLAEMFNVKLVDLNFTDYEIVKLSEKHYSRVSKIPLEVDFMINMPKLKTHVEAQLTICCKNLLGCFQQLHKRDIHDNLIEYVVRMNEIIKPDLHIVDALIAMEGDGPGDGMPKKIGKVYSGTNPFLIDLLLARLFNFDYREVPHLIVAYNKGYIKNEDLEYVNTLKPVGSLIKPKQNIFSKVLLKNVFVRPRYSKFFDPFFAGGPIPYLLYKMKVRQDIYINNDPVIRKMWMENGSKIEHNKVKEVCPVGLETPEDKKCIRCMYCYMRQPDKVKVEGDLGFFDMQMKRFGKYFSAL